MKSKDTESMQTKAELQKRVDGLKAEVLVLQLELEVAWLAYDCLKKEGGAGRFEEELRLAALEKQLKLLKAAVVQRAL